MPHGGARPGSGRKKIKTQDKKITVAYSLHPDRAQWVTEMADRLGYNRSAFIDGILKRAKNKQKVTPEKGVT